MSSSATDAGYLGSEVSVAINIILSTGINNIDESFISRSLFPSVEVHHHGDIGGICAMPFRNGEASRLTGYHHKELSSLQFVR